MRSPTISLLVLIGIAAGCGEDPVPQRPEPKVRLQLTGPADGAVVRAESVEIRGTVTPAGAQVKVRGGEVGVEGGAFATDVELDPGANLVDVAASAPGRRPTFAALRVVREERVAIPDVSGRDADTAQAQLEGLGLSVRVQDGGGFLDSILPGDPAVCATEPKAGTQVLPGSEVTVVVARDC